MVCILRMEIVLTFQKVGSMLFDALVTLPFVASLFGSGRKQSMKKRLSMFINFNGEA